MRDSGTARRARLRLARQRPGASRVRARERAEEPEAGSRLGGLNLLTAGAVVTIVASLGGLVTTGIGAIWSARVSADQLEQSREQAQQRTRDQAGHVSYWVDHSSEGVSSLHLMNRSPDPVADVKIIFRAFVGVDKNEERQYAVFNVMLNSLPPCTTTDVDRQNLFYVGPYGTETSLIFAAPLNKRRYMAPGGLKKVGDVELEAVGIAFVDRDGERWVRKAGKLSEGEELHPVPSKAYGALKVNPPVRAVEGCGSDAKS
ncbi:hypothetical protein PV410_12780 [Streptomyces sp. PA03-5A]|nr:hypothetical protein [Streptomyces sp. PA03-5A]